MLSIDDMDMEKNNKNIDDNNELTLKLKKTFLDSSRVVFLTGAGISKESGIPTFRGQEGLWRKYDPTKIASYSAFVDQPSLVWEFFYSRQRLISLSSFNTAHESIGKLEKIKKPHGCWVLTQNIDGLHQRAGSKNVIELHGNIFGVCCINCYYKKNYSHSDFFNYYDEKKLPICHNCSKILKPNVVLFEEPLPQDEWREAIRLSSSCDLMIIVGTSLNVSPANMLPNYAMDNGAFLVEINPEPTWLSRIMDVSIRGNASNVLPQILDSIV